MTAISATSGPFSLTPQAASPREQLRGAAQAFEAIFLRQLLASARASDFGGDDLLGGPGIEQFEAMRDEQFADIASQQGMFGLAEAIERQLAAFVGDST
ncbi:MAG: rod-binding protein [Erythrobacter sp.]|nr:rod-binding protein [Erythrobacter sp.]